MTHPTRRVLPRSLAPLPEESLPGYVLRLAYRLDRSPWRIGELCGLGTFQTAIAHRNLRAVPAAVSAQFSAAAGLRMEEVASMTMQRFASTYPLLQRVQTDAAFTGRSALVNWAVNPSTRFCPECLRGNGSPVQAAFGGAWNIRWHLPTSFACLQHHRLLRTVCPSCSNPLNTNNNSSGTVRLIKLPRVTGLHPLQCRHIPADQIGKRAFRTATACGARLDEVLDHDGRLDSNDLGGLLALQQLLDQELAANEQPARLSRPADKSFFPDLVMAAHLVRLSWPVGEALLPSQALAALVDTHCAPVPPPAPAQRGASSPHRHLETRYTPTDPAQCGALLLAAHNLLGDRNLASLYERVQPLAREAYRRRMNYVSKLLGHTDISISLARAAARRVYGHSNRANPRLAPSSHRYLIQDVPAFLPQALFDRHFTPLARRLPQITRELQRYLRRAASLRLAELITRATWRQCALLVGVPEESARKALNVLGREFSNANLWPVFEDVVDRIAQEWHHSENRVNYARRRQLMAQWRLPEADHAAMCEDLRKLRALRTQRDPSPLGILIWSNVTQAEYRHSPILQDMRRSGSGGRSLTLVIHRLISSASPGGPSETIRQRVDKYASQLATVCDRGHALHVSVSDVLQADNAVSASQRAPL